MKFIFQLRSCFFLSRAENREKALMTISWIGSAKFLPGRTASYFLDLYKPRQWRRSRPLSKLTRAAPTEEGTGGLAEVLASFWKWKGRGGPRLGGVRSLGCERTFWWNFFPRLTCGAFFGKLRHLDKWKLYVTSGAFLHNDQLEISFDKGNY